MVGAVNVAGFIGIVKTYEWCYRDDATEKRRFHEMYGLPSERERLAIFAWLAPKWDATIGVYESSCAHVYRREMLLKEVRGDVLEVAVGTAPTLEIYRELKEPIKSLVGIDKVDAMLAIARPKLEGLPFPAELHCADAEQLPFADNSFDTVVCALGLCSFEEPLKALDEMARVCREGGRVLLVEPGIASGWFVRTAQDYIGLVPNPKHAWEFGWYDDRDPAALVRASPRLRPERTRTRSMGNWYLISATPVIEE
eukprot:NODE_7337_length_1588_cov_10.754278.p1 GENE.NODE_7337_length_1588_cov_10.754278~~NODE_7337_length_1588_cov_10.754278.p1  ORF type:complete len:282 (-),score=80.95 NODE_7337_length_1588_cov_10.754278:741-1502(-)